MANSKLKTPILQVSLIIHFFIQIRIQRRVKSTFSHVSGNRRKPAQGVFERQPWKQDNMNFHWDQIPKPNAEKEFRVQTQSGSCYFSHLSLGVMTKNHSYRVLHKAVFLLKYNIITKKP